MYEAEFNIIKNDISTRDVVLYMKGTQDFPQCGFSASVCNILQKLGVDFYDVNILENPALRDVIKQFSDWPTIPQLYIKGEFIGGCDVVKELYSTGELQEVLKEHSIIKA